MSARAMLLLGLAAVLAATLGLSIWYPGPVVAILLAAAAVLGVWLAGLAVAGWRERRRGNGFPGNGNGDGGPAG